MGFGMSAFLGFCHVSGGDAPSQLIAAAFCADRPEFEALVGAALAAQGYRLDWAEDVLPAGPWVARHPSAGGAALARLVHEGRHVALGSMTPLGGVNAPQDEDQDWLHVEEIGPITPLDAQFGVHPKKSVPDALHDALFGQPEPSEAERAAVGDALPPLATYAVLDAAKMPYLLTSLLESSGLRYQSLFQGAAQEDLGEHAPYLVELKDGHDFTRRLFTGPNGIGGLWEKELGIFIRSRAGFDALRKHLRKFTRVQDDNGKWFYFRFWEGGNASRVFRSVCSETRWIMTVSPCHMLTALWLENAIAVMSRATVQLQSDVSVEKPGQKWIAALARADKANSFVQRIVNELILPHPRHGEMGREKASELTNILLKQAQAHGFESEYALSTYVAVALELSYSPSKNAQCQKILGTNKHPDTKAEKMMTFVTTLKAGAVDE